MIIALAGRRIDPPRADTPRFPLANMPAVRGRIHTLLVEQKAQGLVCSAACGADLLALEMPREIWAFAGVSCCHMHENASVKPPLLIAPEIGERNLIMCSTRLRRAETSLCWDMLRVTKPHIPPPILLSWSRQARSRSSSSKPSRPPSSGTGQHAVRTM
jgi:hypothetical protein